MTKKTNTKTQQAKKFEFDPGRALLIGAAAFQAYHMGRAFHVYDPDGWHIFGVNFGGVILGAISNFILAQAAIRLPAISATFTSLKELMPKASKKADKKEEQARSRALKKLTFAMKQNTYSQIGFYTLQFFSVLMIAPALYILWSSTLPFYPAFIGLMAVVGAALPDFAITVGGFISGKSLAQDDAGATHTPRTTATDVLARPKKSVAGAAQSARSASHSDGLSRTYPRKCEHCASDSPHALLKSPNAVGGHMKKHHPDLCKKPKSLAVELFEKVEVKQ